MCAHIYVHMCIYVSYMAMCMYVCVCIYTEPEWVFNKRYPLLLQESNNSRTEFGRTKELVVEMELSQRAQWSLTVWHRALPLAPSWLCASPVLWRTDRKVQVESTLRILCVCVCVYTFTCMCLPVCVPILQFARKRYRFSYLRDRNLFQGNMGSKEIQGALCSFPGHQEPGMRFTAV